ncbi:MAG: ribosome biogenesis GTPase Der [Deltaproteobacteria bacterium]|nr:ribosome biogenesis GTPase Der [Deltaproteobacteria bacterium]
MSLTISLIGRPNVGKSTLFNRLVGRRASLVHDEPGLTRDRIYADASFDKRPFLLIDTGGIEPDGEGHLMASIKSQAKVAIEESDAIFFLVDGKSGISSADSEIADQLRRAQKPVYVLVNKTESHKTQGVLGEFYALGFKHVFPVSSAHGQGLGDLFEEIYSQFPVAQDFDVEKKDDGVLPIALFGKPNAGKSSFLNKLLGEDRLLVSEVPGTTVDAVDEEISYAGHRFKIIDTAGIRRKRSIDKEFEKMAVSASLGALDRSKVAIFLIDASAGITEQDLKIASFIDKKSKSCVIVVNKWDLSKELEVKAEPFSLHIREKMPFLAHAPIRFASAKTGNRIFDVLETAWEVFESYSKRVSTSQVNKVLERAVQMHQPPMQGGRKLKFFYATQVSVAPPTFLFTVNDKKNVHFSYKRYLSNRLRDEFGFKGSPIRMVFRERS